MLNLSLIQITGKGKEWLKSQNLSGKRIMGKVLDSNFTKIIFRRKTKMKRGIKKLICRLIGHKWTYEPKVYNFRFRTVKTGPICWCKRCRLTAPNQWEIYQKYFMGKPEGSYTKGTQNEKFSGKSKKGIKP
jgi:hypothetical protein